eukprot:COSAG05_NODE_188_length_14697_cov_11.861145_7_plen_81_part_00
MLIYWLGLIFCVSDGGRCTIQVECFNAAESVAFLRRAVPAFASSVGDDSATATDTDAGKLAEGLGFLPLALAMAAAYALT